MGEKMMKDGVKSEMGKRGGFKYGTHEPRKIQGRQFPAEGDRAVIVELQRKQPRLILG
jgi:hypothetical protein